MRWALFFVSAILLGGTASFASPAVQPQLRLLDRSPIVVRGAAFKPRERVRVEVWRPTFERRRAAASSAGVFKAAFGDVSASRCDLVRVVAVGSRGSRASLKLLPPPGCHTG